ncbi:MAG: CHAT domain-containing protein [Alphaproteobacteria bacterium]|nr:CHAT domain-containing protein [Alphaproteobacteria bacterium]
MRAIFALAAVACAVTFLRATPAAAQADAAALLAEATKLVEAGRYKDAEPRAREALALREKELGQSNVAVARVLAVLARAVRLQGRYAEAEALYRRNLAITEAARGPEHADVAVALNNLGIAVQAQSRLDEAGSLFARSLALQEKLRGPDHPEVATSLLNLAALKRAQGRYAEAEPLYQRSLQMQVKARGPEHLSVAIAQGHLAVALRDLGRYAEAEALLLKALALREKQQGAEHPEVMSTRASLAATINAQGRYDEAETLYRSALAGREKALGPEHPDVAASLVSLAGVVRAQGRFAEAEPMLRRALAQREKSLGPDHPSVAASLNALAGLTSAQGKRAESEPLYRRALAIYERAYGPDHPDTSTTLGNLGLALQGLGRYGDAEQAMRRSLATDERVRGPEHPTVSDRINNLAGLYLVQGRYPESAALYRRSLAIRMKALGPEHPSTAQALSNLASAVRRVGRPIEAERLFRQALALRETIHGPEHPAVAATMNNLGFLLRSLGRSEEAEPLYRRSLAIREKLLGQDHPDVAESINNVASVLRSQGKYDEAAPLFQRSFAIWERALGKEHPLVALSLANLAELSALRGDDRAALAFYRRSTAIRSGRAEHADDDEASDAARLSEQRLSSGAFRLHLAAAARVATTAAEPERTALNDEAFRLLDLKNATSTGEAVSRMAARFAAGTDALAAVVRERQDAVAQLDAVDAAMVKAVAKRAAQRDGAQEQQLRERAAALQRRVAEIADRLRREFPAYGEIADPKPLALADAQALLGPHEALMAFVVGPKDTHVFALRKDRVAIARAEVGAKDLAAAVKALRAGLDPTGKADLADLAPFDATRAHALYAQLFAPAAALLEGAKHLFLVPDASLGSLPVGVLLTAPPAKPQFEPGDTTDFRDAPWLAKRMAVSVLPSVGSLRALRSFARQTRATRPFLGIGDPMLKDHPVDMNAKRAAKPAGQAVAAVGWTLVEERPNLRSLFRGATADPEALRQVPSLPDTADELAAMARSLGAPTASLMLREGATEATVKKAALSDHKVLAFATHGVVAGEIEGLAEPALILTPPGKATPEDDGLLTASEVAQLKLDADWVILSACNTAAPDGSPTAEGLSGLAKAFFFAGARALLVSHWPVVSEAAVALTTSMLKEAAQPGTTRAEAHRLAVTGLIDGKAKAEFAHPVFWAPFVVVGEGGR